MLRSRPTGRATVSGHARDVDPADRRAHARLFVDHQDEGDVGGARRASDSASGRRRSRSVSLSFRRFVIASTPSAGSGCPTAMPAKSSDLLVGQEGVAVDADFADDLRLGGAPASAPGPIGPGATARSRSAPMPRRPAAATGTRPGRPARPRRLEVALLAPASWSRLPPAGTPRTSARSRPRTIRSPA